jgi:hypothetical protein
MTQALASSGPSLTTKTPAILSCRFSKKGAQTAEELKAALGAALAGDEQRQT